MLSTNNNVKKTDKNCNIDINNTENNAGEEEEEENESTDNEYNYNADSEEEYEKEEEKSGNENIDKKNIPAIFSWADIKYTGDSKEDVTNFIENKVKQEEFEKNNKKTLEVLGILEDVNNVLVKNKNDEDEARINSKLTPINNPSFEEDINTNENDDVNTILEVNSILEKKINENEELNTLRKNQKEKFLNGAINSYYELRQAQSEIEEEEKKIKEEQEEELTKQEKLEIQEIKTKNREQQNLLLKEQQKTHKQLDILIKKTEEKKNKIRKGIGRKNSFEIKVKLKDETLTGLHTGLEQNVEKSELNNSITDISGPIRKTEKVSDIKFLTKEEKEDLAKIEKEEKQLKKLIKYNRKNYNVLIKSKKKKEETELDNLKKKQEKEREAFNKIKEERKVILPDRLNAKKEKVIKGLKEVEERIITLSPSIKELNSAIDIKKREIKEEEEKKKEVSEQQSKEKNPANIQPFIKKNMEEQEEEIKMKEKFFEDLKNKVEKGRRNYANARVFRKLEDNIRVLDKYMKGEYVGPDIKKRDDKNIKVDIKDPKIKNEKSEENGAGFKRYINSSIDSMEKMVEKNTIITKEEKEKMQKSIDLLKSECENINEENRDEVINKVSNECKGIEKFLEIDNIKRMVEKNTIITEEEKEDIRKSIDSLKSEFENINEKNRDEFINKVSDECKGIEEFLEKKYNIKQKGTTLEEEFEEEGIILKGGQQLRNKNDFLTKLHKFISFIKNYNFGTKPLEKSEDKMNKNTLKEKKEKNEELIISTKPEPENKIEIIEKKNEILIDSNIEKEKGKINNEKRNEKRSARKIIEQGNLFDEEDKQLVLSNTKKWYFDDEKDKIVKKEYKEEMENKNDDKSLIAFKENPKYEKMKERTLEGDINTNKNLIKIRKGSDNKGIRDNLNNRNVIEKDVVNQKQYKAEYVLRKGLRLYERVLLKRKYNLSKKILFAKKSFFEATYHDHFNYNYNKNDNTVAEKEEDNKYINFKNTWEKESSKFSLLVLLRGFGRIAISLLFSTINSIMQFERKDVIGPYFSIYTLSFGRIVQPSFLRKNIYIDISLSLLSLLIFSAVDSKIERYYLSKYMIKSPLCKFLSLIKYTTNAFNININFFVNKDFYMSLNVMSIFDFILSWYWFNEFKEKIQKDIIEEYDTEIKSITEKREEKYERLEEGFEILKKACGGKRHKLNFLRSLLVNKLVDEEKKENNIDDNSFLNIENENNINNEDVGKMIRDLDDLVQIKEQNNIDNNDDIGSLGSLL